MNVQNLKAVSLAFALACLCLPCFGQSIESSTVKITTAEGYIGSGFIVAKHNGIAEVWTNAHVLGGNSSADIEFGTSGSSNIGTVKAYKLDRQNGVDAAKLLVPIPGSVVVSAAIVGDDHRGLGTFTTGGFPRGLGLSENNLWAVGDESSIGVVFNPAPENGQSGSQVRNDENEVVGVITWRTEGTEKNGIFQPISNWKKTNTIDRKQSNAPRIRKQLPVQSWDMAPGQRWIDRRKAANLFTRKGCYGSCPANRPIRSRFFQH